MTELYLSRLMLNTRNNRIQMANARAQIMHYILLDAFERVDSETPRSDAGLLYRLERDGPTDEQQLLVQSKSKPHWAFAERDRLLIDNGADVKEISPIFDAFTEGRRLRFRVLLSARSRLPPINGARGQHRNNVDLPDVIEWFRSREERLGFALTVDSEGAIQLTVSRKQFVGISANQRQGVTGCATDGILAITDKEAFERSVRDGIGTAKTYGFGLLSLMPHNSD